MTTSEKGNQIREAVGVFGDADAMQTAIEEAAEFWIQARRPQSACF